MKAEPEWHEVYVDAGYLYCRPCDDYHRPPECPIDQQGQPNPAWAED